LFIIDDALWKWAKYRASTLGYKSVSEYIFALIKKKKQKVLDDSEFGCSCNKSYTNLNLKLKNSDTKCSIKFAEYFLTKL